MRDVLITLGLAVAIYVALQFTIQHSVVISGSMEPTMQVGQHFIINKVAYRLGDPQRGDVIVFHPPTSQDPGAIPYIKRVIGLPGDYVEVKGGLVYVNGTPLDEPFIKDRPLYTRPREQVAVNEYFVLGDNRNNSGDSHYGWTVPRESIMGKAWLSVFPLAKWGLIGNYSLASQVPEPDGD